MAYLFSNQAMFIVKGICNFPMSGDIPSKKKETWMSWPKKPLLGSTPPNQDASHKWREFSSGSLLVTIILVTGGLHVTGYTWGCFHTIGRSKYSQGTLSHLRQATGRSKATPLFISWAAVPENVPSPENREPTPGSTNIAGWKMDPDGRCIS